MHRTRPVAAIDQHRPVEPETRRLSPGIAAVAEVFSQSADGLLQTRGRRRQGCRPAGAVSSSIRAALQMDPLMDKVLATGTIMGIGVGHRLVHGGHPVSSGLPNRSRRSAAIWIRPSRWLPIIRCKPWRRSITSSSRFPKLPAGRLLRYRVPSHACRGGRGTLGLTSQLADEGLDPLSDFTACRSSIPSSATRERSIRSGAGGRVVLAHLGNGASMAAVDRGTCIDTSMGFTPTGGLVMGTRSGDLDPRRPGLSARKPPAGRRPTELSQLVDKQSGLLGVSGTTADMRELAHPPARTDATPPRRLRLVLLPGQEVPGRSRRVPLGGLDRVVFTGGIGEHAAAGCGPNSARGSNSWAWCSITRTTPAIGR